MPDDVPLYDRFSADYDVMVDWKGRLAREWPFFDTSFSRAQPKERRQRILDVGCGTGAHAVQFALKGREVVGADPSRPMLDRALIRARDVANVDFVQAGFGELRQRIDGDFDIITCLGNTLPHARSSAALAGALLDMASMLRPGGLLILQQLNYDRICATRQRFLGLTAAETNSEEVMFFRFYDFVDPLLRFNVITFRRPQGETWSFSTEATMLLPVLSGKLGELLTISGFRQTEYYGTFEFAPFDPETSNDLVVIAVRV